MTFYAWAPEYQPGERFTGGAGQRVTAAGSPVFGALRAIDPATGERKWEFKYLSPSTSGLLTTASGLVFTGDADGNFIALDSRKGTCSGGIRWARRSTARPPSPTPSTDASMSSSRPGRRSPHGRCPGGDTDKRDEKHTKTRRPRIVRFGSARFVFRAPFSVPGCIRGRCGPRDPDDRSRPAADRRCCNASPDR